MDEQAQTRGLHLLLVRQRKDWFEAYSRPGSQMPFNLDKVHYSNAEFYNDFLSTGSGISQALGIYLPIGKKFEISMTKNS